MTGHAAVDLHAELGEGFGVCQLGDDEALLDIVSSVNIACGFHASDPTGLLTVCRMAAQRGVRIGAQVAYRDLAGFGRRYIDVAAVRAVDPRLPVLGLPGSVFLTEATAAGLPTVREVFADRAYTPTAH